ncbi:Zinc finger RING FYVE PHD-type [Venturia nashicola]|uniref:Zinc finger RING FYVE PHD-type n=1 Tax=Venturia nashicola TaxID=86259 RepID=A0A4Z1PPM0_9PEZI|nr:Zinc finger RING FYVE PHD-type [Venturia nashicola]
MSSFAGDGDSLGQEGRGKTLNIGKSFIKRIAYRIRGGAATPETNAAPEEPSNDFVLDVERDRAAPSEPKAIPTSVRYVESNVSEILPQPGSNANLIIPIKYVRGADRHERTRRLLAKYGLSVEAQDWMPAISNYPATVLRVEKQIRMRVRFTCHLCEHIFGANRNCKTCNHKRCLNACIDHRGKGYGGYVIIAETLLQRDQKCVANVFTNGVRPVEGFPRKD